MNPRLSRFPTVPPPPALGLPLAVALVATWAPSCTDADPGGADDDSAGDGEDAGPCAGGGWGSITPGDDLVWVAEAGSDDTGDGSRDAPFATIQRAVTASRTDTARKRVAVLSGTWREALVLTGGAGGVGGDAGLSIEGCGDEGDGATTLRAPSGGDGLPVVQVSSFDGAPAGVRLAGFAVEGGRRALYLAPIGGAAAPVEVSGVTVRGATAVGISVDGHDTIAVFDEVWVEDTAAETGTLPGSAIGYGIGVGQARLTMTGGGVTGSTSAGIIIEGALTGDGAGSLILEGVTVEGTLPDDAGQLGRGIQAQFVPEVAISGTSLVDNADAGLFVLAARQVTLAGLAVSGVGPSIVPEVDGATSGDGIVVTSLYDPEHPDPNIGLYAVTLDGCDVSGAARAGVVLERVTAAVGSNSIGAGSAGSVLAQGYEDAAAYVTGEAEVLAEPLPLNHAALSAEELGS